LIAVGQHRLYDIGGVKDKTRQLPGNKPRQQQRGLGTPVICGTVLREYTYTPGGANMLYYMIIRIYAYAYISQDPQHICICIYESRPAAELPGNTVSRMSGVEKRPSS
jgi:hypothetical protein